MLISRSAATTRLVRSGTVSPVAITIECTRSRFPLLSATLRWLFLTPNRHTLAPARTGNCVLRWIRTSVALSLGAGIGPSLAKPTVVAIDMGYGHLRPARSIATMLGCPVLHADQPPLADAEERDRWATTRGFYETMSRISATPWVGKPFQAILNAATSIPPLHPFRDLSARNVGVRLIEHSARKGLGRTMVAHLQEHDSSLVTTFYSPALLADFHGYDRIYCIVTDSDVNRVWAPIQPRRARFATSLRAAAWSGGCDRMESRKTRSSSPGFRCRTRFSAAHSSPSFVPTCCPGSFASIRMAYFRHQFAQELEVVGPAAASARSAPSRFCGRRRGCTSGDVGELPPELPSYLTSGATAADARRGHERGSS